MQVAPLENILLSAYDKFVEENARIRAEAGMKEIIIREALGGCCAWCANLAGIYEYGNHPKEVFQRHDNCTCMVTNKSEKAYTDVWSKKSFATHREARIARIKELDREVVARKEFMRKRRIAQSMGMKGYDATEEWKFRRGKQVGNIRDATPRISKSIANQLAPEGHSGEFKFRFNHDEQERIVAKILWTEFGGDIMLLPVVDEPKGIRMADYLWNNKRYDLKTPRNVNKDTIYNAIHKKKRQAKDFIIDITRCGMDDKEAQRQGMSIFRRDGTDFVDSLIIIKDKKILCVLERLQK